MLSRWGFFLLLPAQHIVDIPRITLDYHRPKFNESRVALLIENRPLPNIAPLTLHMMSVVPPDWRFRFMGSPASVALMNDSVAIQHQVNIGKLDLTYIPANMSTNGQEMISQFLTTLWLYDTVLQPAENLLIFQTDSEYLKKRGIHQSCLQALTLRSLQASSAPTVNAV